MPKDSDPPLISIRVLQVYDEFGNVLQQEAIWDEHEGGGFDFQDFVEHEKNLVGNDSFDGDMIEAMWAEGGITEVILGGR